ncbi:MAG TPA: BamA/TamA family outer membrane protein, partial [Spirochaetota bacterium]|nr:BamA/TamA family outer membrane protein [Spirochaetota bacterium]
EKRTGMISAGAGYGTASGFSVHFQLQQKNFLGKGQTFNTKLEIAQLSKTLNLQFAEPWLLRKPIYASATLRFYLDQDAIMPLEGVITNRGFLPSEDTVVTNGLYWTNVYNNNDNVFLDHLPYSSLNFSFSLTGGYRFYHNLYIARLGNTLNWEQEYFSSYPMKAKFDEFQGISQKNLYNVLKPRLDRLGGVQLPASEWLTTDTVTLSLSRDSRNHGMNPTHGSELNARISFVTLEEHATKFHFDYAHYFNRSWLWKFTFIYSFQFDHLGDPLFKNFNYKKDNWYYFTMDQMRGWEHTNVSRFQNLTYGDARYLGQARYKHSFEIRAPFTSYLEQYLWGVIFCDMGYLSTTRDASYNLSRLIPFSRDKAKEFMYSLGWGVRIHLQMLPLRFYWAYNFIYNGRKFELFEHEGNKPKFVFSVYGTF